MGSNKHGMTGTSTYSVWATMKARCSNCNNANYHNYGGRGITVSDSWQKFENFYADMGERPEGMSLDRIDNDKGYSADNCRWASVKQQMRNTRINNWITFNGKTQILKDWADELGLSEQVIHRRLNKCGWSVEDALTIPVNGRSGLDGSNNGKAKLDEWSVKWIKRMLKAGNKGRYLADIFGVNESAISSIKSGQRWSQVEI